MQSKIVSLLYINAFEQFRSGMTESVLLALATIRKTIEENPN